MDAFFAHTQELLSQGYIQVLIGMYIAAQAWWWLRKTIALRNKRFQEPFTGKYSVIVVAYRPDPTRLTRTLKSIAVYGSPAELIVAIDEAPKAPKKLKNVAAKYATKVIESATRVGTRELYAKAAEALKKRSDVIVTVAPGAVWDESTHAILAPFADERVGAVSGHEAIVRPTGFVQWLGEWLNRGYFAVIMPFQSALGGVRPVSPHIMAVRREVFTTSVRANRSETFLGRRVLTAYNESITAHILTAGMRTVYQPDATVTVPTPESLAGLRLSYAQRYRGSLRSLIRHGAALRKTNPFVTASIVFSLFSPVVYVSVIAVCVFMVAYGVHQFTADITTAELVASAFVSLVIYLALSYLRHAATVRSKKDALWLPAYVLAGGFVVLWAKTVALFTFTENARDSKAGTEYGEGKVGRARTAAAGLTAILFLVALPVAYGVLVHTQNVPLGIITSQQGRPYALAREYSDRLRDADPKNDPNATELTTFIRANGTHYGQNVNDTVAAGALLCVRDALKVSSLHGALDNSQACYAQALAVAQDTDPDSHLKDNVEKPALTPILKMTARDGDTLTWLIRSEVKKLDTKKELSAAQAVYIETTYLSQAGQLDRYLAVDEQIEINLEVLDGLADNAKKMSPEQIGAWNYYAQNIVW